MQHKYYINVNLNVDNDLINVKDMCYLDNNSTTIIYDENVKRNIINWISCGNPSNILHDFGKKAHDKVEQCRHIVAHDLRVTPQEVFFTSGATESNNIVVQGVLKHYMSDNINNKIAAITTSFEHPSVLNIFKHYEEKFKLNVVYVDPCKDRSDNEFNCVKAEDVLRAIHKMINNGFTPVIISVMHGNNETGAVQNIKKIGEVAEKYNIFFHSDVTQTIGKYVIRPEKLKLNAISFSGHKFHGPKGAGCLYLKSQCSTMMNLCYGGDQEGHKRPGTENVANILGLTMALQLVHINRKQKNEKLAELRSYLINGVKTKEDVEILGPYSDRSLPNTVLIKMNRIGPCNKKLVEELNSLKICVSVGSACQTESNKASHVLNTLGLSEQDMKKVIRISLSDYTTKKECDYFINNISLAVDKTVKK